MKNDATAERAPSVFLVVDDDPLVRGLMARVLVEEGFPVVTAASGEEGLVAAQALEGDLPLGVTDIRMPGMDGIEMAERLVQLRRASDAVRIRLHPTLALTGPAPHQALFSSSVAGRRASHALRERSSNSQAAPMT